MLFFSILTQISQLTYLFVDANILSPDKAPIVAFSSRTSTPVKRRYPQLDLKAISTDFSLRYYQQYVAGEPDLKSSYSLITGLWSTYLSLIVKALYVLTGFNSVTIMSASKSFGVLAKTTLLTFCPCYSIQEHTMSMKERN